MSTTQSAEMTSSPNYRDLQINFLGWRNTRIIFVRYCASSFGGALSGVSTLSEPAADGTSSGAWNSPGSFPAAALFMNSIQMGNATRAPVSRGPRDFFSSYPTQTPQVIDGEKPTNQASVKSFVVPVLPANGNFRLA